MAANRRRRKSSVPSSAEELVGRLIEIGDEHTVREVIANEYDPRPPALDRLVADAARDTGFSDDEVAELFGVPSPGAMAGV